MIRRLSRAFWWIAVHERPTGTRDYAALWALLGLVLLGALVLSWPWLVEGISASFAAGLSTVRAALASWALQLRGLLPAGS